MLPQISSSSLAGLFSVSITPLYAHFAKGLAIVPKCSFGTRRGKTAFGLSRPHLFQNGGEAVAGAAEFEAHLLARPLVVTGEVAALGPQLLGLAWKVSLACASVAMGRTSLAHLVAQPLMKEPVGGLAMKVCAKARGVVWPAAATAFLPFVPKLSEPVRFGGDELERGAGIGWMGLSVRSRVAHDRAPMQTRRLGQTDLQLPILSFGASSLGAEFRNVTVEEALKSVHVALECGLNFIDTSPFYGRGMSEVLLGIALKGVPRDSYTLCTKLGRYDLPHFDFSAKRVAESVDVSLHRLGTDHLDIVLCHDIEFVIIKMAL